MLKLPKNVIAHPRAAAIETLFSTNMRELWHDGGIAVPVWSFGQSMQKALGLAYNEKHLVQGLDSIEEALERELKGLKAVQVKQDQAKNQRLSRLLLLSNDGSERFYRQASSILSRHEDRTLGCIIDATSDELGRAFTRKANPAKALIINDRKALEIFLIALAEGA